MLVAARVAQVVDVVGGVGAVAQDQVHRGAAGTPLGVGGADVVAPRVAAAGDVAADLVELLRALEARGLAAALVAQHVEVAVVVPHHQVGEPVVVVVDRLDLVRGVAQQDREDDPLGELRRLLGAGVGEVAEEPLAVDHHDVGHPLLPEVGGVDRDGERRVAQPARVVDDDVPLHLPPHRAVLVEAEPRVGVGPEVVGPGGGEDLARRGRIGAQERRGGQGEQEEKEAAGHGKVRRRT